MKAGADHFDGKALGVRMRLLRELRDMSLQAVADASGLTKSHVWELEQGRSINPTVNAIWGLAGALCVSPAQLLGLKDNVPPIEPVALKIAGIVDREIKRAVAQAMSAGAVETERLSPQDASAVHESGRAQPSAGDQQ